MDVENDGRRCCYDFSEIDVFLNSVNYPTPPPNYNPPPCILTNVRELYPVIDGVRFPYYELIHPDFLDDEFTATDEEANAPDEEANAPDEEANAPDEKANAPDEKANAPDEKAHAPDEKANGEGPKIIKEVKVKKSYTKKGRRGKTPRVYKADVQHGKIRSRHEERKGRKPERRRTRHSSYSSQSDDASDSEASNYLKELHEYRKLQKQESLKVQYAERKPVSAKQKNPFRIGSPLRSVNNEGARSESFPLAKEVSTESEQFVVENLPKTEHTKEITLETIPAVQSSQVDKSCSLIEGADVITKKNTLKSKGYPQVITVPENDVPTCQLPPLVKSESSSSKKDQSPSEKNGTKAIKLIQSYSSHSEGECEDKRPQPTGNDMDFEYTYKRSRLNSPDTDRESSKNYKRSRLKSPANARGSSKDYKRSHHGSGSEEERRSSRHEENYSNYGDSTYGENESYYCEYCLKTMNSLQTWESHILGKKHLKAQKLAHPEQMAFDTIPQLNADVSRRLRIRATPPGHMRVRRSQLSKIQNIVEELEKLCPGLEEVIELIAPQNDYSYYCKLCDAICMANSIIPHIVSFRHKLNYLKVRNPKMYEALSFEKKPRAEPKLDKYFISLERREGRGIIQVYEDVPLPGGYHPDLPGPSSGYSRHFSDQCSVTSDLSCARDTEVREVEPETDKGDYFCNICKSHMNSENMWISHINGKRHIKNVNKAPGERPSKIKFLPSGKPARLYEAIRNWEMAEPREDVICGLDYVGEKILENDGELYMCYLCQSNSTAREIIEHIISLKHMRNYIKMVDEDQANRLTTLTANMSTYAIRALHLEACAALVEKRGMGKVEVQISKR